MKLKTGFKQFMIRTAVFFAILISLQMGIFLFLSGTAFFIKYFAIPDAFYLPFLTGLNKQNAISSAFFVVVSFLLWRSKEILEFSDYKQNKKETLMWGILALGAFISHYGLKLLIRMNLNAALGHAFSLTILKYALNILFVAFLALAVYNKKFIFSFIKKYRIDILVFTFILFLYYQIIWLFQDSWLFFSNFVGNALYFIFSKQFSNVVFRAADGAGPTLGVENFYVSISKVCSGIDSLLFFISLFAILVITNWDSLNKMRMALLFIPGIIGTYLLNILRIYLLVLIAVKISPEFAVNFFHTNAGWVFFLGYFILFWHFGRKWVIKNA
jgi:exosortase/archaeosortase family protein